MEPVIIPRSDHPISRKSIDPDAVKVLYRLHRAGYQAYLVGGGVRDLLLGRPPKDFDVGTDAHPHQVKRLFRNCRLIGRRFRLAHVHFGGKIVEVSTFRKRSEPEENGAEGEDILIRSDNTFGNAEEDALRRDFTINGLFYDIGTFSVIDYVGGLEDLTSRLIRTIGDPDIRFREDPVRMIRAVKFAARLDFSIQGDTWQAILDNHEEIMKSAPPRVLEEIYRLLGGGAAEASFRLLHRSGMLQVLIPDVYEAIEEQGGADAAPAPDTVLAWLRALDQARANDEPLTNPILIGSLLAGLAFEGNPPLPAGEEEEHDDDGPDTALPGERSWYLAGEAEEFVRDVIADLGVPRRDTERLFQVYRALRRFVGQRGRRFSPRGFVTKNYFPEAFLFFRLAATATGDTGESLTRWQKLAEEAGVDGSIPTGGRRRRRRRRRRGDGFQEGVQEPFEEGLPSEDEAELESLAEAREPAAERPAPPHREPHRPQAAHGRAPRAPRSESPSPATRPPRPPAAHGDDEDEDSQIKFLGWSDQPEILRDRPEPPPLVNPYTRQPAGGRGRHGGYPRGGSGGDHRGGRGRDQNGRGGWGGGPRKSSGPQRGPSSGGSGGWGQRSSGGTPPTGGGAAESSRPSGGSRSRRRRRPRRRD